MTNWYFKRLFGKVILKIKSSRSTDYCGDLVRLSQCVTSPIHSHKLLQYLPWILPCCKLSLAKSAQYESFNGMNSSLKL